MFRSIVQKRNPFTKENPYFVSQKFYSQEKDLKGISKNKQNRQKQHSVDYRALQPRVSQAFERDYQINYSSSIQSNYRAKGKLNNQLKKKHVQRLENPFFRKHLVSANQVNIEEVSLLGDDEVKLTINQLRDRIFYSNFSNKSQNISNNYKKNQYVTTFPTNKYIAPAFIKQYEFPTLKNTQLHIKLTSAQHIDQSMISDYHDSSRRLNGGIALLGNHRNDVFGLSKRSLHKSMKMIQQQLKENQNVMKLRINDDADIIYIRNKAYYKQTIQLIY